MSMQEKKTDTTRVNPRAVIRAARKTTELSLRKKVDADDEDGEPVPTVPSVVRRRSKAGIKSVKKTTEVPLD